MRIKTFWWLNWFWSVNKYWIVVIIDMLINGIKAAVLGLNMNEGNKAIPGARYNKNTILNTTSKYVEAVIIRYLKKWLFINHKILKTHNWFLKNKKHINKWFICFYSHSIVAGGLPEMS